MNYLAHIHLAKLSGTSMVGNFLGDFVKGSEFSYLSEEHQHGIKLHRRIDSFTDHHKDIKSLRECFPKELRRMSGVVIDIHFDHLLCQHWKNFDSESQEAVLDRFYNKLANFTSPIEGRFELVKKGLLECRWLNDYQAPSSCERAYYQIEKRLKGKVHFAEDATEFVQDNSAFFTQHFLKFYPQLIEFSIAESESLWD
jgi:acyl carrier protein phosphodiesterase